MAIPCLMLQIKTAITLGCDSHRCVQTVPCNEHKIFSLIHRDKSNAKSKKIYILLLKYLFRECKSVELKTLDGAVVQGQDLQSC